MDGVPHPVPYQGSKRALAHAIMPLVPVGTERIVEPFAGSAAVSLAARRLGRVPRVLISDVNEPLMALWRQVRDAPTVLADRYESVWSAALADPVRGYDQARETFNATHDPALLLYLLARCVKSAVRYNAAGAFNQSADRRRVGRRPDSMRRDVVASSDLLQGSEIGAGDYREHLLAAGADDLVYLDPPYQGVSGRRDRRYVSGLSYDAFVADLRAACASGVSFVLSYDGSTGERAHGRALPAELGLHRTTVAAGRSAQATLQGRVARTVESLYVSPALQERLVSTG